MITIAVSDLSRDEARNLTDQIRTGVDQVWRLLIAAHDRRAWAALGYPSWQTYVRAEFNLSRGRSYQLIDHGRVIAAITEATGEVSTKVDISEREARDIKPVLPMAMAAIRERVDKGVAPDEAIAAVVGSVRAEARSQRAFPEHSDVPPVVSDADYELAELREANAILERERDEARAELAKFSDMRAQYEAGGFEAVIAGKDEEIRVLKTRLAQESADKASYMRSDKAKGRRLQEAGLAGDVLIDPATGEVSRG